MNYRQKLAALAVVLALAGAAAASVADVRVDKRLYSRERLQVHTGTATINTASVTWSSYQSLVTIKPDPQNALMRCRIIIDLDHASTGWHSTGGSATITCTVARAVDGTNFRDSANLATTALSGTNATGSSIELDLGSVGPTEQVRLDAKLSSASGLALTDIPYVLYYEAAVPATLTLAN